MPAVTRRRVVLVTDRISWGDRMLEALRGVEAAFERYTWAEAGALTATPDAILLDVTAP